MLDTAKTELKEMIVNREGTLVVRPDSGDPATIVVQVHQNGRRRSPRPSPLARDRQRPEPPADPESEPTKVVVTRWGDDPFAYGSYSFVGVNATGADYTTLAEPVGKELYFAGEHCIEEHPATVVGAYLSGIKVAKRIAKDWPLDDGQQQPKKTRRVDEFDHYRPQGISSSGRKVGRR